MDVVYHVGHDFEDRRSSGASARALLSHDQQAKQDRDKALGIESSAASFHPTCVHEVSIELSIYANVSNLQNLLNGLSLTARHV